MAKNTLSRQCIIIGSFSIALGLVLILIETQELLSNLQLGHSEERRSMMIRSNSIQLVEYAAAVLFSIFLIWGIIKRKVTLMTPWLITAFAGVAFVAYVGFSILMILPFGSIAFLLPCLAFTGMATVVLYPLCSLFREIWLEKSEERRQMVQDEINYNKKFNSGYVDVGLSKNGAMKV